MTTNEDQYQYQRAPQSDLTDDERRQVAEMWKGVGNRHMASQEYSKAYSAYSTSLSLSPLGPSSHIYLSNRAASLLSLKRYSAASVDARRAITLAPTFGKAHARLGQCLYFLKDYAGAVKAYEDAFTYEPDNQVTWTYLNKARRKLERKGGVGAGGDGFDGGGTSIGPKGKMTKDDVTEGDTNLGPATFYTPYSTGGEMVGNDMMSVTDSVNLQNMKITVDDTSDIKNIDVSVMKDQVTDRGSKKSDDKFYDDIFDLPRENKNSSANLMNRMQKTVVKPQPRSFQNASKMIGSTSRRNNQNANESKPNNIALPGNNIYSGPSDEMEEESALKNKMGTNQQYQASQFSPPYENEDDCTTNSDPDFETAIKIQQSASTHLLHRRYKLAVEEYSAALFLVPDDENLTPALFVGRAYALNGQGRHLSAQNDAMMALGRRPEMVDGHVALARSLFYGGNLKGAVRSFENAIVCLQRTFGDLGGGGVEDCDDGNGLSKLDQLYLEKARAGLIEQSREGKGEDDDDDEKSHGYSILSGCNKPVPKLQPPRFVSREKQLNLTISVPSMPKAWSTQVPQSLTSLRVGPERLVTFFSQCLGIKLNRGSDGIIRVVSITEDTDFSKGPAAGHQIHRKGIVEAGDVIREAAGVDLRRPITKFMWSDTVSLLKITPRPVKLIVSKELSDSPQGFLKEVSKSKMQVGAMWSKRENLGNRDADYNEDEEKLEITRFPNMPNAHGSVEPPSRSGGTESVTDSIRATIDEDIVDGEIFSRQEVERPLDAVADINENASDGKTVADRSEDDDKESQDEGVDVGRAETSVGSEDENIDAEKKEQTINDKSGSSEITIGMNDLNGEQKETVDKTDSSNNNTIESEKSILLKNDKNDKEQEKHEPKLATDTISDGVNNNANDDKETVKRENIPGPINNANTIPIIVEDSTEAVDKSILSNGSMTSEVTQKANNVNSNLESRPSDISFDGVSYSLQVAGSASESKDTSSCLSLSDDGSDSGIGISIGSVGTPHTPSRNKTDIALDGLVNDDPLHRKEILFVRSEKDVQPSSSPTLGWTNDLWLAKSHSRILIYSRHIQILTKGRFFWSSDQYVPRALALYKNPYVILVLRSPLNVAEVKESLNIPDELDLSSKRSDTSLTDLYWVAERVIDLQTCKLRLSQLTTPTSVVVESDINGGVASENEEAFNTDFRRATCFEIINPLENVLISAVVKTPSTSDINNDDEQVKRLYLGKSAISVTSSWEHAITKALCAAHAPYHVDENNSASSDKYWKHLIVLGSLHSHVVSGNNAALQKAIDVMKWSNNIHASATYAPNWVSIDKMDENGMTALHYACTSRSSSAVSMLVKAGADCTIPTKLECKTPCHLSAELLDQTSISVILAASKPRRPDPNALDSYGQTPMYVAAVHGRSVGVNVGDPDQLRNCLLACEAWGGQLYLLPNAISTTSNITRTEKDTRRNSELSAMEEMSIATNQVKVKPHPIHSVSAEWRHAELETLFAFCPHRYPIESEGQFGFGRSLGAMFDYPLHACAISLRKKLIEFNQKRRSDMFGKASGEPSLISTMRILLNHGLEPNERLEYVNSATEFALEMNEMTGFTPCQIIAGAGLDIISDRLESGKKGVDVNPSLEFVSFYVSESVQLLMQHGARILIDPPPLARPNRENPLKDLVVQLLQGGMTSLPMVDREKLNIEKNGDLLRLFGGKAKLNRLKAKWHQAKIVKAPPGCKIPTGKEFPSSVPDFELPGGSDSTNCAICWKIFGLLRNRKHMCRLSRRYVCEECSSKSVLTMDGGGNQTHRASDGQFIYSKFCSERISDQNRIELQKRTNIRKKRIEELQSKRYNSNTNTSTPTENSDREELFSGSAITRSAKNFFSNRDTTIPDATTTAETARSRNAQKSTQDQLGGITSSLNLTKDSLNERGERLNSLSDKTSALKDASADFASMAKELKKSQESGGMFW